MHDASPPLISAARDYRWLLDRAYPQSASLKLVGDRHRLDRDERLVLFRGVFALRASASRRARVSSKAGGRPLLVDAYNQLFAVMHYLAGRPVFISSDGLLRDAGASHGRIADRDLFARAQAILADAVAATRPSAVSAFFDAPVPFSADHARAFEELLRERGLEACCSVERSADGPLKAAGPGSSVATGDSAIVDALIARAYAAKEAGGGSEEPAGTMVFDAARCAIERAFGPREWLDFGEVLDAPSLETPRGRP